MNVRPKSQGKKKNGHAIFNEKHLNELLHSSYKYGPSAISSFPCSSLYEERALVILSNAQLLN
jgi:hypothetical protein